MKFSNSLNVLLLGSGGREHAFARKIAESGKTELIIRVPVIPTFNDTKKEIEEIKAMAFKINDILKEYFLSLNVKLVDFKLEFGRLKDGTIVLADEISPDTCRFWDADTNEKLDKDRFRRDMGGVEDAYNEMMKRVFGN